MRALCAPPACRTKEGDTATRRDMTDDEVAPTVPNNKPH